MYRPRRVVITGGSSGLGLNFALEFAARHSELFLLARSVQGLEQAGAQIERRFPGTKVTTFPTYGQFAPSPSPSVLAVTSTC